MPFDISDKKMPPKNEESQKIRFLSFGGDVNYIQLQNFSLWGSSCVEIWSKQFLPAWRTHARTSVQLGVRAPLEQYFSYICVHHQNNFACPLWKIRFVRKCRVLLTLMFFLFYKSCICVFFRQHSWTCSLFSNATYFWVLTESQPKLNSSVWVELFVN
jgi:hypothetical protein